MRDEKELHPRTCWNKFSNVMSFLKAQGIRGLVHKNDWPHYVEEEPEVYEREDLDKFFAACDDQERLWFEFFLMTGMREQEVTIPLPPSITQFSSTERIPRALRELASAGRKSYQNAPKTVLKKVFVAVPFRHPTLTSRVPDQGTEVIP